MAQLISLIDAQLMTFIKKFLDYDQASSKHDDISSVLMQNPIVWHQMVEEDSYPALSAYTKNQFIDAFYRIKMANWPHLTGINYEYATGTDRIMLPHEVTEEQRARIAGSWIIQEQDSLEYKIKQKALRQGEPINNLFEMDFEATMALAGASFEHSVPSVQEASEKLAARSSAVKAFLDQPHPALRLCSRHLQNLAKNRGSPAVSTRIINFPGSSSRS
jgi:hypothetical protein